MVLHAFLCSLHKSFECLYFKNFMGQSLQTSVLESAPLYWERVQVLLYTSHLHSFLV